MAMAVAMTAQVKPYQLMAGMLTRSPLVIILTETLL
jgi:hypothetical protein